MGWTTITEDGQIQELQVLDSFPYSYDRMQSISDYTGYDFSVYDQSKAIINDVKNEAYKTGIDLSDTVSSIGNGISTGAQILKFLPILAIGYFLLSSKAVNFGK